MKALLLLLAATLAAAAGPAFDIVDVVLPPHETTTDEEYLCTSAALPGDGAAPLKLTGVAPLASKEVVHHMLLFGCSAAPHPPGTVWPCQGHSVCSDPASQHVLYGWAKDAPPAAVPDGAAFRVGAGSGTRALVLQVHYSHQRPPGDKSGVRLNLTSTHVPFSAGLTMFARFFSIPPKRDTVVIDNACCLRGFEPLHAFAYRVHTHDLGRSVYLDVGGPHGVPPPRRVAERSPQLPQGFAPVAEPVTVWPGDTLTQACVYNSSTRDFFTQAGATHGDEMCNLYLMAWSEAPAFASCGGPPVAMVDAHGPGSLPGAGSTAVPESETHWPPTLRSGDDGAPPPAPLGQASGVARAGNGTVWVLRRAGRAWDGAAFGGVGGREFKHADPIADAVLLRVDQDTGEILARLAPATAWMPHMATGTRDGNVWLADAGAHTVSLLDGKTGAVITTLGTPRAPGAGPAHFCKPTHVAVGADGTVYVADGYCGSRVAAFKPDAAAPTGFVHARDYDLAAHAAATRGAGHPAPPLPHAVVVDDCGGRVLVADREAGVVRAFSRDTGAPAGAWDVSAHGYVYALVVGPYGAIIALTWARDAPGAPAAAVVLADPPHQSIKHVWPLPGVVAPHDAAIVAAPLRLAGADRPLALLVAEARPDGGGAIKKFVLMPDGVTALPPDSAADAAIPPARELWRRMHESAAAMRAHAGAAVAQADAAAVADGVVGSHAGQHAGAHDPAEPQPAATAAAATAAATHHSTDPQPTIAAAVAAVLPDEPAGAAAAADAADDAAARAHHHHTAVPAATTAAASSDAVPAATEPPPRATETSVSPMLRAKAASAARTAAARAASTAAAARATVTQASSGQHGLAVAGLAAVGVAGVVVALARARRRGERRGGLMSRP